MWRNLCYGRVVAPANLSPFCWYIGITIVAVSQGNVEQAVAWLFLKKRRGRPLAPATSPQEVRSAFEDWLLNADPATVVDFEQIETTPLAPDNFRYAKRQKALLDLRGYVLQQSQDVGRPVHTSECTAFLEDETQQYRPEAGSHPRQWWSKTRKRLRFAYGRMRLKDPMDFVDMNLKVF